MKGSIAAALFGLAAFVGTASAASAQVQLLSAGLEFGSGAEVGTGSGAESVVLRSPAFLDLAARAWSDEREDVCYGGSLRLEFEGGASVAVVPRVEYQRLVGPVWVRPGVGVPFFFAPFSMLGVEAGVSARVPLLQGLNATAGAFADAFFWGSDLPGRSIVLMFNGMIGGELLL